MRIGIALLTLIVTSILLIAMMGCSGDGASVNLPPVDEFGNDDLRESVMTGDSGHKVFLEGSIAINTKTKEVFNIPDRRPNAHLDATQFVVPPACWDCLTFPAVWITQPEDPTKLDWHIKVRLRNPTPLVAYEARAIFFFESSGKFHDQDWSNFMSIPDPDGYTRVFGGGVFHPFINWIKGDYGSMDRFYGDGWAWTTDMVFRIPNQWNENQLMVMHYKIDVSYPGPIKESPGLFQEFVTQEGAWYVTNANGTINIPVWDWQADIASVKVNLQELHPTFGDMEAEFDYSELPTDGGAGPDGLHHYVLNFVHDGDPPLLDGTHTAKVTVTDSVSGFELVDYITLEIGWDNDPPTSFYDGGEYEGLIDLMNGDTMIRFYYDRAVDPSGVLYIFYHNFVQNAWDENTLISKFDCNEIYMNWPPNYPACYYELAWGNGEGRWWSIDAWDNPNNKAHTTSQKWGEPVKPVERWHKLAGNLGDINSNWGSPILTDMDGDNDDDVIIANRMAKVYCFDGIGGGSPAGLKWTFDTNQSAIYSTPAAVDVTGDNIPEIFISTNGVEEGGVFAINGATGFELWSATLNDISDATVCLADINGGGLDVAVGDNSGNFYAFDGLTGAALWAQPFQAGGGIGSSAAAGDVNGDEIPDFTFGAYDGHVYMVDGATGTLIWKFNCGTGLFSVESSPAMYDADGDNVPDVVIGADKTLFCFKGQGIGGGDTYALWSTTLTANLRQSPAIGDCNFDGVPDVVITGREGQKDLFIIDGANGNGLYDWELPEDNGDIFTSPILADVTADGHLNVIFGAGNDPYLPDKERYWVLNVDRLQYCVMLIEMPTTMIVNQCKGMPNSPTLGDVDNDGKWDLAFGSVQGRVYVHNFDTAIPEDPELRPWISFRGNDRRSGQAFEPH